jgi:hypothetical protein
MLPGGSDELYRRVLGTPHEHYARIEVWSGLGVQLAALESPADDGSRTPEGLVFLPGTQVSATLGQQVARNMNLVVPSYLYPVEPTDLLAPFGNEIRAFYGVRLGDGDLTYVWQVFRGRIQDVSMSAGGGICNVVCADRGRDVLDVGFVQPENSNAGDQVLTEFQRLVNSAVPDATFGVSDTFGTIVRPLTWQSDRGGALDELAQSVGSLWYALANGDFVMRRYPWAFAQTPVVTLSDQQQGMVPGCVQGWTVSRSRSRIYNTVTVSGERLNGDTAVFATARDTNPVSPTFVDGGFGIRSYLSRLQTPATQGGAAGVAQQLLRTAIAPTELWSLEVSPDGSLELGDPVRLLIDGRDVVQVVSGFTLPLDLSGNMSVDLRSVIVGTVDEGGAL